MILTKAFVDEGSWGPEYAQLHDDVLSGRAREKYLVIEGIEGLADSLSLIAGMLYVAVLSGRALQIRENVPYSVAYDKPNIDWRYTIMPPSARTYKSGSTVYSVGFACMRLCHILSSIHSHQYFK